MKIAFRGENEGFFRTDLDRRIWEEELESFVPEKVFDAHVRIWSEANARPETPENPLLFRHEKRARLMFGSDNVVVGALHGVCSPFARSWNFCPANGRNATLVRPFLRSETIKLVIGGIESREQAGKEILI